MLSIHAPLIFKNPFYASLFHYFYVLKTLPHWFTVQQVYTVHKISVDDEPESVENMFDLHLDHFEDPNFYLSIEEKAALLKKAQFKV